MTTPISFFTAITTGAAAGSGLIAGLFFVFSVSVMQALAMMKVEQGMLAMQLINRTILNPIFLIAFVATAAACLLTGGLALWQRPPGYALMIAGALLYIVGGFGITVVFNVPLNNALDVIDPNAIGSVAVWENYVSRWTLWNHVRTVASLLGSALLTLGLAQ